VPDGHVVMPRPAGHPIDLLQGDEQQKNDKPVITSASPRVRWSMAFKVKRPRNCEKRASPIPPAFLRSRSPNAFITAI